MDFYAPGVKWIQQQKQKEKTLFNELLRYMKNKYATWEYKLNHVEHLLNYNHINEGDYLKKMNELQYMFNWFETDGYPNDRYFNEPHPYLFYLYGEEKVLVWNNSTYKIFHSMEDIYYYITKENRLIWEGSKLACDLELYRLDVPIPPDTEFSVLMQHSGYTDVDIHYNPPEYLEIREV